ncbi:DUF6332 family protein [Streptomyces sp. NPDC006879]|uniref:DUF6332 family protein n=1 Tax=Streptomyces sp. NPDC006879 TaxID=3364767 RepID=UPI0036755B76
MDCQTAATQFFSHDDETTEPGRGDEIPVEIGYALLSAGSLGAVVFATIAGSAAVWHLPPMFERFLLVTGAWAAGALAVGHATAGETEKPQINWGF